MTNVKRTIAGLSGLCGALSSLALFVWVFYNESMNGRGILFIEPNRTLAFGEMLFAIFSFVVVAVYAIVTIGSSESRDKEGKEGKERTGYETNHGTAYQ